MKFERLTRGELRDELKRRGLVVFGLKHELVERLEAHERQLTGAGKGKGRKGAGEEKGTATPGGMTSPGGMSSPGETESGLNKVKKAQQASLETTIAAVAGFSALAVSVACCVAGDGLTAGNLASLHVSLAGIFVAARASNRRARGWQAQLAVALAMVALAVVAFDALGQDWRGTQQPLQAAQQEAELVQQSLLEASSSAISAGHAESSSLEDCQAGDDAGVCSMMAKAFEGVEEKDANSGAMHPAVEWAIGVRESLRTGDWRSARFSLVLFWGLASVAAYATLVEALPGLMRPLHPALRALELLHNILLALTSLAMLVGIIRACVTSGKTASLHDVLCSPFDETDPVFVVTSRTFFWSKAWEWVDTALLVSKGKPVSWLHYTHHASTTIGTAFNMVPKASAMWPIVCASNSFVHTWMYAYYSMPRFPPLRRTRRWLTRAQILQHVVVLTTALYALYQVQTGGECYVNTAPLYMGVSMYFMYLIFFSLFYQRAYSPKTNQQRQEQKLAMPSAAPEQ